MYSLDADHVKGYSYTRTRTFGHAVRVGAEAHGFQRLRLLIEQLRDEDAREFGSEEPRRGWPGRVAKRIGISKELVDKIGRGERTGVQASTIETVCMTLKLDRAFFADEHVVDPKYVEYVDGWWPAEWPKFRRQYGRYNDLTPEELVRIKRMRFRDGRTVQNLMDQADLILGGGTGIPLREEETEAKAAAEGVQKVPRKGKRDG